VGALIGLPGAAGFDKPALFSDANGVAFPFVTQTGGVQGGHYKTATQISAVTAILTSTPYYWHCRYQNTGVNTGTLTVKINGITASSTVTDLSVTLTGTILLGSNYNNVAKINASTYETLAVNQAVSAGDLTNIETYLRARFPSAT